MNEVEARRSVDVDECSLVLSKAYLAGGGGVKFQCLGSLVKSGAFDRTNVLEMAWIFELATRRM